MKTFFQQQTLYPTLFLLSLILLLRSVPAGAQAAVQWTDPVEVAGSGQGTASPRLVLDAQGEPVVLWGKGGSPSTIRLARRQNGAFTAPVQVGSGNVNPSIYDFGGLDLAINGDTFFVVFENFSQGIYMVRSTDGGQTFDPPVPVFTPASGKIVTLASVAIGPGGNPLVSYLYEAASETNAIYHLARSTDGGLSFEAPVNASEPAGGDYVCECCPSDIVTRGDSVWLGFRSLRPGNIRDIWVTLSTDGGASFNTAADADDTDWVQTVCPTSAPRLLLSGDQLAAVWMSKGSGINRIHASAMNTTLGKVEPSFTFPFSGSNGTQNRPDISGHADTLGVVWEETGIPGNSTEILFAFSTEGVTALPLQISNLSNAPGTQKLPSLAYRDGVFHLVYADVLSGKLWYRRGTVTSASPTTEPEQTIPFSVFPNPASTSVRVNWPDTGYPILDLHLVDALGRICRHWNAVASGQTLTLDGLQAGTYFLQAADGQGGVRILVSPE